MRHLHRRQRRLKSLVPHLQPGAINRLLQRVAGQHTKRMRHSSLLRRLPDAARNLIHDHVVMRLIAAEQEPEANDRIVLLGLREHAGGGWNFERSGNANQRDVFLLRARAQQSVVSALKKPFRDKGVEARDDNCKPTSRSAKPTLDSRDRRLSGKLDFYFFFRGFLQPVFPPLATSLRTPLHPRRSPFPLSSPSTSP